MSKTTFAGRILFGLALIGLGLEPFVTGHLPAALVPLRQPLPPWLAMVLGAGLIGAVLSTIWVRRPGALLAVAGFPTAVLLLAQLPDLWRTPDDPTKWSGVFQVAGFVGAALLAVRPAAGRVIFAGALIGFGVQHFMYAGFIASLIPVWIPGPLFWAYLTGVAFCAAAVAALTGRATQVAGYGLGLMFLSWVIVLHGPRIANGPAKEPEWSSGLVALAMAGAGLSLAGPLQQFRVAQPGDPVLE